MTNVQAEVMADELLADILAEPKGTQRVIALAALAQLVGRYAFELAWDKVRAAK